VEWKERSSDKARLVKLDKIKKEVCDIYCP